MRQIKDRIDFGCETWLAITDFMRDEEARSIERLADPAVQWDEVKAIREHLVFVREVLNIHNQPDLEEPGLY